jgi:pimeloyl-ACP methyl ester carboxylesterase
VSDNAQTRRSRWPAIACLLLAAATAWCAELKEGQDYSVVEPDETWRGPQWPVVTVLVEPGRDLTAYANDQARFTASRGALLAVLPQGLTSRLEGLLAALQRDYPVRRDYTVLVGRDALAPVVRALALRLPDLVSGFVLIDDPAVGLEVPMPAPALPPGQGQRACLLVVNAAHYGDNRRLQEVLRSHGISCALQQTEAARLPQYLGLALTALLPPTPARHDLTDPATRAKLVAAQGWEFVRHEHWLAQARPERGRGPQVVIATGALGERTFEDYVTLTGQALHTDGIELLASDHLADTTPPVVGHAFRFVDRRQGREMGVYWILVSSAGDVVSFRAQGRPDELAPYLDTIRGMALAVRFPDPQANAPGEAPPAAAPPAAPVVPAPEGNPPVP